MEISKFDFGSVYRWDYRYTLLLIYYIFVFNFQIFMQYALELGSVYEFNFNIVVCIYITNIMRQIVVVR